MVDQVTFERTTYANPPNRFEAGTPNIAGAIGLAAALNYVTAIGVDRIASHERELLAYAIDAVSRIPGLRLVGTPPSKASILSFTLGDIHPHDISTILDRAGVAIRAGHHCCQPLMARFGLSAAARASFAFYNTRAEVDTLVEALQRVRAVFA